MSKGPQRIRGTQDIWGEEADRFGTVVDAFDRIRRLYGFQRIEIPVFEQDGIPGTSTPWPKELRIEPGTYYWRVAGMKGDRVVADSGRAAFVVRE